jgi:carbon-monoxide dehydrogenase medium subunit
MNEMTNSHILLHRFDFYEPTTLEEAISLLARHDGAAKLLAGGTDLLVHMKMERIAPRAVVSINRIPGLDRIYKNPKGLGLHIGSRATIKAVEKSPDVQVHYQALAEACAAFSTTQVQTMGTIGGNLGNGSPAADSAPSLIAFGAEVELTGPAGVRRLPLEQFFLGPGKTALQRGELISDVILPPPAANTGSAFLKLSRVAADIAKANCAVVLVRDGDRIADCRMAFGSVAATPMRAPKAEMALIGRVWSEELAERAGQLASEEVAPIDDVRSDAWYRREVVRVLAFDGLTTAWQRARNAAPNVIARSEVCDAAISPLPTDGFAYTARNDDTAPTFHLAASEKRLIELRVNGRKHAVWVSSNDLLLNILRDQLQLTGAKYGCGIGECSACTVQMDGAPVLACLVLAVSAVGHDILTVEGLAKPDGELDPLQNAFIEYAAYQCGYCTSGMLLTAKALLTEKPRPSEDDIRRHLRGNLCRCTGYASIVRAVLAAANERMANGEWRIANGEWANGVPLIR